MEVLSQFPDQRQLLVSDVDSRLPGFIEETLRYTNLFAFSAYGNRDVAIGDSIIEESYSCGTHQQIETPRLSESK